MKIEKGKKKVVVSMSIVYNKKENQIILGLCFFVLFST